MDEGCALGERAHSVGSGMDEYVPLVPLPKSSGIVEGNRAKPGDERRPTA